MDRAVPGKHAHRSAGPKQIPASPRPSGRLDLAENLGVREITRESGSVVEQERDAVVGMTRRVQDLAGQADSFKEGAAVAQREQRIAMRCDVHEAVAPVHESIQREKRRSLFLQDDKLDAETFQLLGETCMIHMVVRCETVPDLAERHPHTRKVGFQHAHRPRVAEIKEKA